MIKKGLAPKPRTKLHGFIHLRFDLAIQVQLRYSYAAFT